MEAYPRKVYYLVFGIAFLVLWFLFKLGGIPDFSKAIPSALVDVSVCMIGLYTAVELLIPWLLYKNSYAGFSIALLILVLVLGSVIIFTQLSIMGTSISSYQKNIAKYQEHYFYWFWSDLIFGSYFLVAFISLLGCAIRFAFDRVTAQRKMEAMEGEKLASELMMLRQQINPHFLFNALNTVYYAIDKSNAQARRTLEQFSSLLRYQLYECDDDLVPIEKEVAFLSNYIDIQSQRLNGSCRVAISGFDGLSGFGISPYLLGPLIENCFKHANSQALADNFIAIECRRTDNWFWLQTENNYSEAGSGAEGGIGLVNMRKRLQLVYPGRHELSIEKRDGVFKLTLKLKILCP